MNFLFFSGIEPGGKRNKTKLQKKFDCFSFNKMLTGRWLSDLY